MTGIIGNAAGDHFTDEPDVEDVHVDLDEATEVVEFHDPAARVTIHLQLRPRFAAVSRCMGMLHQLISKHEGVNVSIAGVSKDAKHFLITLGIDAGQATKIARTTKVETEDGEKHPENLDTLRAFAFTQDLHQSLFDFLPQYAAEPTAEERRAVASLLDAHGSGTLAAPRLRRAS